MPITDTHLQVVKRSRFAVVQCEIDRRYAAGGENTRGESSAKGQEAVCQQGTTAAKARNKDEVSRDLNCACRRRQYATRDELRDERAVLRNNALRFRREAIGAQRRRQNDAKVLHVRLVDLVKLQVEHDIARALLQIGEDALNPAHTVCGAAYHQRPTERCNADLPDVHNLLRNADVVLQLIRRDAGQVKRLLHHSFVALTVFNGVVCHNQGVVIDRR